MPTVTTTHPLAQLLTEALGEPDAIGQYGRGFTTSDPVTGLDFGTVRVCLPEDPDEQVTVYGFACSSTPTVGNRRAPLAWEASFGGSTPAAVILAAVQAAREAQR